MERLTRCVGMVNGKPVYKANIDMRKIGAVDKLKNALGQYEDAEEQGLLLKLPCKVGDKIYRFWYVDDIPYKVQVQTIKTLSNLVTIMESGELGKNVFLTQEEAEKALAELSK